jgi:hypothetical protein
MNEEDPSSNSESNLPSPDAARLYLLERGVLEEIFTKYGGEIDSQLNASKIAARLARNHDHVSRSNLWAQVSAVLWFKVWNGDGELVHYIARPLPSYGEAKFVAPIGSDSMPWIPQETRDIAKDIDKPIIITEGPIKGMTLWQAGAFPISLFGVWGAAASKRKIQPKQEPLESPDADNDIDACNGDRHQDPETSDLTVLKIHPELARFALEYRQVLLCFDADHKKNRNVRQAEIRTFMLLYSLGADVYQLCTWPLAEGKGIDDYFAGKAGNDPEKQKEVFAELCGKAVPFIKTLDRRDIEIVRKELYRTLSDPALFKELAKALAKQLNIAIADLILFKGSGESGEQLPSGAKAIEIPPTAEPWSEPVVAQEVLDEICKELKRFVVMEDSFYLAVALWIVLTYLHDAVDILPILLITSPVEDCGKSTLLELVLYLSNRPIPASNISAAAIYRVIGDNCPTLVLDEADTYMQEDEVMRGVINSGHKRQFAFVIRVINDKGDTGQFSTWCPKAIARIGQPKRTILSRSIPIRLERKAKGAKTEKLKSAHALELEDLRRKISRLANDIRGDVRLFRSNADWLNNRAGDNWEPLFAIASAAGEECLKKIEIAARKMSSKAAQDSKSFGHYVLESLGAFFAESRKELEEQNFKFEKGKGFFIKTEDILAKLNADNEAPWRERKDQLLTGHKLAKELREYDISPSETSEGRGYWSDKVEAAFEKYMTEAADKAKSADKTEAGDDDEDEDIETGGAAQGNDDADWRFPF